MATPSKLQVLVVDDDPNIRETVAMLLISEGYDVVAAEDGFQALVQIRNTSPDVILSDLNMPRMSGFELLSVVRRRFPHILTIAMSGAYRDDELPPGVVADGFYSKGKHPETLFRSLKHLLSEAALRSSRHHRELSPAWIPRDGHDPQGVPYVTVTCMECLLAFPVTVVEETSVRVLEIQDQFWR